MSGVHSEVPVLIIGGGPVGFCLALELAFHGQRSMVVEQDAGTGLELLAKAGTLNERTMEFCRRWGIVNEVANAGFPEDYPRDTFYCTSLNGHLIGSIPMPATKDRKPPPSGPEMLRKCGQHIFDPLVARAAAATGKCEIRYSMRFESYSQDADGVNVELSNVSTGKRFTIRAQYLVGCDGSTSAVRQQMGVALPGRQLDYSVSAMIRVQNIEHYHPLGKGERYMFIDKAGTWANMTTVNGVDLWRFTLLGSEDKLDLARLDMRKEINRALGRDDIPYEVMRVVPWRRAQTHAVRYRDGRVLLAGDACHTTSPTGGHGLNTGIGDVASVGWMLDAVMSGWGGRHLLDAYEIERRPVAIRNLGNSTENYEVWLDHTGYERVFDEGPDGNSSRRAIGARLAAALKQEWHSLGIGMAYNYYCSPIVYPDGSKAPPDEPSTYIQTSRPGHRAPHAWLPDGHSTLDLFGHGFTLLILGSNPPDTAAFEQAALRIGFPLTAHALPQPDIAALYVRKMVLVRPDGMVAWRGDSLPADVDELLDIVRGSPAGANRQRGHMQDTPALRKTA